MINILIVLCAAVLVWLFCFLLSKPSSQLYILDEPTHRSLHDVPKPRTGGIAIVTIVATMWLIISFVFDVKILHYYILAGLCILVAVSYLDDKYSVPQLWRLSAHIIAALFLVLAGVGFSELELSLNLFSDNNYVANTLTILVVVWMINLYNFMDGMDGLAGGMGFIGFLCLAGLGWLAGHTLYVLLACIIAAANLGFLIHNFPPAKLFMGDVGSISMGYLVAFFSLWGIELKIFGWWAPLLIFSPFLVDATVTLVKRALNGKKIWEAHKSHYYQMLVQSGLGHKKTAILEYILMLAVAITVIVLQLKSSTTLTIYTLFLWFIVYVAIIVLVTRLNTKSGNTP